MHTQMLRSREPVLKESSYTKFHQSRVHTNFNDTQRYVSERKGFNRPILGEICNISAAQIHGRVARWFSSEKEREKGQRKNCARASTQNNPSLCAFVRSCDNNLIS
jgi:hypothetical protein